MNKKNFIKKMAVPAVILFTLSLIILIVQVPIKDALYKNHKNEFNKYFISFNEHNYDLLKDIAGSIKSLPVDTFIVTKIDSTCLINPLKLERPQKYIWMSSINGNFIFGAPDADFQKLNDEYNEAQQTHAGNNKYYNRNKFLESHLANLSVISKPNYGFGDRQYFKNTTSIYSNHVYDYNGKLIGELHLLVDDKVNVKKYLANSGSEFWESVNFIFAPILQIAIIFLWFLLPTWVYLDAKEHMVENPGIWVLLTVISFIFGLIIYLIVRPNPLKSYNCPECNGKLNESSAYCPYCGCDLKNMYCQYCKYPIKLEWQFCPNCKAELKSKDPNETLAN